ncbi:hypothetical protein ACUOA5_49910, partial [Escherichia coli]
MAFSDGDLYYILAYLNSEQAQFFLKAYSPSPRIKIESLLSLPLALTEEQKKQLGVLARSAVSIEKKLYSLNENAIDPVVSNKYPCSTYLKDNPPLLKADHVIPSFKE